MTDGAGFRWDIYNNGIVNSGTNNTFNGAMRMITSNGEFYSSSDSASISKDGREIELGPFDVGGRIRIWRRIYIEPDKNGYCRWIDIYENTGDENQNLEITYRNNFRNQNTFFLTTGGRDELGPKDWGFACGDANGRSSFVVQMVAGNASKLKPSINAQKNTLNNACTYNLELPTGKTAAICIIMAQRKSQEEATKMLRQFDLGTELAKVPEDLRNLIVNMAGGGMSIGSLNLPTDPNDDMITLRNGDQMKGVIVNQNFTINAFYGKIDLPAEKVLGLCVPIDDENRVQLALTDGQIILGTLAGTTPSIRLTNGDELSPPVSGKNGLRFASYSSKNRKPNLTARQPMIIMQTGEQLFFNAADMDLTFKTEYGPVKLQAVDLSEFSIVVPEGGLNKAIFRNGSILSGLLACDEIKLALSLGPTMTSRRGAVLSIKFPGEPVQTEKAADISLRNENRLVGRILEETLTIQTFAGTRRIKTSQVKSVEFTPGMLGYVNVKEHSGTIISGTLENQTIRFKIEPGPELNIYAGHIVNISNPEPPPQETRPASAPATKQASENKTETRPSKTETQPRPEPKSE